MAWLFWHDYPFCPDANVVVFVCAIFWRLLCFGLRKTKIGVSFWIIAFFVAMSIIVGFLPQIGHKFALSRIIFFCSLFLSGSYCSKVAGYR